MTDAHPTSRLARARDRLSRGWGAARAWLRRVRFGHEHLALVLAPLLMFGANWLWAQSATVINDAYSYVDEFNDNVGIDQVSSTNWQNFGGYIQATAQTMDLRSPCFSLPQPAGATFDNWRFLDLSLTQTTHLSSHRLEVINCADDTVVASVNNPAASTSLDLRSLAPSITTLHLRYTATHTATPNGTTVLPVRVQFWRVYGQSTGSTKVTATIGGTLTPGPHYNMPVTLTVTSTGAQTPNAVLVLSLDDLNGLSSTGAAVAPDDGLASDAEVDYGRGNGLQVYRPVTLQSTSPGPSGEVASGAVAGANRGSVTWSLGTLAPGYSGSVPIALYVPTGTAKGATVQVRARLRHGATPLVPIAGISNMEAVGNSQVATVTSSNVYTATYTTSYSTAGPGATGISTQFYWTGSGVTSYASSDGVNMQWTVTFNTGTCTPIIRSISDTFTVTAAMGKRILQSPTIGQPGTTSLVVQYDRIPRDTVYAGPTVTWDVPATCTAGQQVKVVGTMTMESPVQAGSTTTHTVSIANNYCHAGGGAYVMRTMQGTTWMATDWPAWPEYYIYNTGSLKAGDYYATWAPYGEAGNRTQTVKLDRTYSLVTIPAGITFHGLQGGSYITRIYKDSTGTAPLPTDPAFVATSDPPHAGWKPVTLNQVRTTQTATGSGISATAPVGYITPFNAAPNDNNPSAVVAAGSRLLFVKFDDNPAWVGPDYGNFRPEPLWRIADGSYGVAEVAEGTAFNTHPAMQMYSYETVSNPAGVMRACGGNIGGSTMYKESASRGQVYGLWSTGSNSIPAGQVVGMSLIPENNNYASAAVSGKWVINLYSVRDKIDLASVTGSVISQGNVPTGGNLANIVFTPPNKAACLTASSANDVNCMAVWTVPANTQIPNGWGWKDSTNQNRDNLVATYYFRLYAPILRNVAAGTVLNFLGELRKSDLSAQGLDNAPPTSRHAASNFSTTMPITVLEAPLVTVTHSGPATWPRNSTFTWVTSFTNAGNANSNGMYAVSRLPVSGVGGTQFTPTLGRAYFNLPATDLVVETSSAATCFDNPTTGSWSAVSLATTARTGYLSQTSAVLPAGSTCLRVRRASSGGTTFAPDTTVTYAIDIALPNSTANDGKNVTHRAKAGALAAWGSSADSSPVETSDLVTQQSQTVITGGTKTAAADPTRAGWVRWDLRWRNISGVDSGTVTVTDAIPSSLIFDSLATALPGNTSCVPSCTAQGAAGNGSGGQLTFRVASLLADDGTNGSGADEGGVSLWMRTVSGTADNTALSNCVTTDPGAGAVGSNSCTTVYTTWATTTMTQTVIPSQGGTPAWVSPNDTLRYQVTVVNSAATAQYIRLYDVLPALVDYVPGSFMVDGAGASDAFVSAGTVNWISSATVAAGGTTTIRFDVKVKGTALNNADIFNSAVITQCTGAADTSTCRVAKSTSQVQARVLATAAVAGSVFEDVNYGGGAGRSMTGASGVGRPNVRIELYSSAGALLATTTTNASGAYSFTGLGAADFIVRVVNSTVLSSRSGAAAGQWPVQTYRVAWNGSTHAADTARVGGEDPAQQDASANPGSATLASLTGSGLTPQSIAAVRTSVGTISGIDFGFNFSTIVNTNDSGQGSLRQWITQANALGGKTSLAQTGFGRTLSGAAMALPAGVESTIFMIPSGSAVAGLRAGLASGLTSGVALISPATLLPAVTASQVSLDATTQTANVGDTNAVLLGSGSAVGTVAQALARVPGPEVMITGSRASLTHGLRLQAGGTTLRGFAVRGFGEDAAALHAAISVTGANILVEGNVVGTGADAFADPGLASRSGANGIAVNSDNAVIQYNLVGWTGEHGIIVSGGANGLVTGNEVRSVNQDGTACCGDGVYLGGGGGWTVRANLIVDAGGSGVDVMSASATIDANTLTGNGVASGASDFHGVHVRAAGATVQRNVIQANWGAGVAVPSVSTARVSQNSIWGNGSIVNRAGSSRSGGSLGIDLGAVGVNANDGVLNAGQANNGMDFPRLTLGTMVSGQLDVRGYVGTAPGQSAFAAATIEVYKSDGDASGFGQGRTYLGTLSADANGNFSGKLTLPGGVTISTGDKLTATATDAAGNTSEFGSQITTAEGLFGTVYEDVNYGGGPGRNLAASFGVPRPGARVELYDDLGNFLEATVTDVNGTYGFTATPALTYYVRVVNSTVLSSRSGATAALLPVLTYRTTSGTAGSVTGVADHVGGIDPAVDDAPAAAAGAKLDPATGVYSAGVTGTAQALAPVGIPVGGRTGIDFGFNFDTVTSTRDAGAGSLRQVITNANTLGGDASLAVLNRSAGIEHVVFMIPNGTTGPGGSLALAAGGLRTTRNAFVGGVATIAPTSAALPQITAALVLDARTQPGWAAQPVVELNGSAAPATSDGLGGSTWGLMSNFSGSGNVTLAGLVINRFAGRGIVSNSPTAVVVGNWIGLNSAGTAASPNGSDGLHFWGGGTIRIGGATAADMNVVSGNSRFGLYLYNTGSAATVIGNRIGTNAAGTAAVPNLAGVIVTGAASTIGGTAAGEGNLISGNTQTGVTVQGTSAGTQVLGNRIGTDVNGTTAVPNVGGGIRVIAPSTVIGGTAAGSGNLVSGNGTHGILVTALSTTIQGNLVGTDASGLVALANAGNGVYLTTGAGYSVHGAGHLVGGTTAAARNVLAGNTGDGLAIWGDGTGSASGTSATIQGNYIGVNVTGTAALANAQWGIRLDNAIANVQVGGSAAGVGNVISGNGANAAGQAGLQLNGSTLTVQGNTIGYNAAGTAALPNKGAGGVWVKGGSGNTIGGTASGEGNLIAGNTGAGVLVESASGTAQVRILGNRMFDNSGLGIDLKTTGASGAIEGVTANDGAKTAGAPNLKMDSPVFTSAKLRDSQLTLAGYVGSAAGQALFAGARVEVFVSDGDASGYGEGKTYLGSLTTDASGNFAGVLTLTGVTVPATARLTATATDGAGNTSEFGANFTALVADFVVNDNGDADDASPGDGICQTATTGICTLRAALTELRALAATPTPPTVLFDIPGCTDGTQAACTIRPATNLPFINRPLILDGSTQPGWSSRPLIGIDGGLNTAGTPEGLRADAGASGSTFRSLRMAGWGTSAGYALHLYSSDNHIVEGCWFGLDASGAGSAATASRTNIAVRGSSGNRIGGTAAAQRNIIAKGSLWGIYLYGGSNNTIQGNFIGTDATGAIALGNAIGIANYAATSTIGGAAAGAGNLFAANATHHLLIDTNAGGVPAASATVQGNTFGLSATQAAITSASPAIMVSGVTSTRIGGTSAGEGNTIANATGAGVALTSGARGVTLQGNSIYATGGLGIDLGNDGVTANDDALAPSAINQGMDHPVILEAGVDATGASLTLTGYVGAHAGVAAFAGSRVEVFKSDNHASGYGSGRLYLGSLVADASGRFTGTLSFAPGTLGVGDKLTATATGAAGDTSEFGPNWTAASMASLSPSGLNAFESSTPAGSLTGVLQTKTAGTPATIDVIVLNSLGTGLHTAFNGTVTLEWMNAADNSGTLDARNCRSSWTALSTAGTVSFAAGDGARRPVTLTPPDAGRQWRLRLSATLLDGSTLRACATDAFAVRPARLSIDQVGDADDATPGTARTLNTTAASGGAVHRAGRPFSLRASARNAGNGTTPGYDGTPSLSLESCPLPASGCIAGVLSPATLTASGGSITSDALRYGEVGAIRIKLSDPSFADIDAADTPAAQRLVESTVVDVGRFVPDNYLLTLATPGVLATAQGSCAASGAGFTFFGQAFGWSTPPQVTITARATDGSTTVNWAGALMKLDAAAHAATTLSASATPAVSLTSALGPRVIAAAGPGQATLTVSAADAYALLRAAAPQVSVVPVFNWLAQINDTSETAVAGNAATTGSVAQSAVSFSQGGTFHYGRLKLNGAHGDMRVGVRLLIELQKYSAAGWTRLAEDDHCLTTPASAYAYENPQGRFSGSGNLCVAPLSAPVALRGGRGWLLLPKSPDNLPGRLTLRLNLSASASGSSCSAAGAVMAASTMNLPYLQGAWAGSATQADDPFAAASWGQVNREFVLRRERLD